MDIDDETDPMDVINAMVNYGKRCLYSSSLERYVSIQKWMEENEKTWRKNWLDGRLAYATAQLERAKKKLTSIQIELDELEEI